MSGGWLEETHSIWQNPPSEKRPPVNGHGSSVHPDSRSLPAILSDDVWRVPTFGGFLEGELTDALLETLTATRTPVNIHDTRCPGLYVRLAPDGKIYMVRFRENGEQIHLMVGRFPEIDVSEARSRAGMVLSGKEGVSRSSLQDGKKPLTLGRAMELYIEAKQTVLKPRTLSEIRYFVTHYCPDYLDRPLDGFDATTAITISNGITRVRVVNGERKIEREAARNMTIRLLRAIFNYMKEIRRHSGENPFSNPRRRALHSRPRVRELPPAYYMNPEIVQAWAGEALRHAKDPALNPRARDAAGFALFLLLTGLRIGDGRRLTSAHLSTVNATDLVITLKNTKNRRDYLLPVPPLFRPILERVARQKGEEPPGGYRSLFRIRFIRGVSRRILETLQEKFPELRGQRPLSPHDLRKLYTSAALRVCGDANLVNYLTCHVPVGVVATNYMFIPIDAWKGYAERIQEMLLGPDPVVGEGESLGIRFPPAKLEEAPIAQEKAPVYGEEEGIVKLLLVL